MLEKISEQYSGAELVSEKIRHSESFLKAMLAKDGITILHHSIDDFLISNIEFNYIFSLFDLWDKHAITLPGFHAGGSSGCGMTSLDYYLENCNKEQFSISGHKQVLEYLKTEDYFMLRKAIDEAENEIGIRLKDKLNHSELKGHISRFKLYITKEIDDNKQLISLSKPKMEGFREVVDYYSARKQDYR